MVFLGHDEEAGECHYCACSCAHVTVCVHVHTWNKLHIHFILVLDLFPSLCLSSNAAYNISVHSSDAQMEAFYKARTANFI